MSVIARAEVLLRASNYSGSGNWLDESGNGHDATPVGSPTFNSDHFSLDGSTQWFTVSDSAGLDFTLSQSFTVVAIVATDSLSPGSNQSYFGKFTGGVGYWGRQLSGQNINVGYIDDGTNNPFDAKTSAFPATGTATVLAVRRDVAADEIEAFADGVSSGSPATDTTTATLANGTSLFIGAQATSTEPWGGDIYAFALFREALTDAEIVTAGQQLQDGAFIHGKGAAVFMNEFDFSSDFTQYNFRKARQLVNVTTFGNDDKVFLAGLGEGGINVQGVWNPAANQTDEEIVALDGTEVVITASPEGATTIGDRAHVINGELDNYQPRAPHNDAVRFSASYMGDDSQGGIILHEFAQESATGNFQGVAGVPASTAFGAVANLHVTQFSGTDATITIEDSSDDSTYGSLVAFTQVTGTTSERVSVAGTVERYVRVALTGTFTTITFVVSFARLRL